MLPEAIHSRIQMLADANDVSAAWIIRAAVMQFLAEHGEETKLPLRLPKTKEGSLT
ncbi:CopG family transcriptional regulator [Rhizobium phaseoli]|uniref:CopG family transcriptional regulator n=2 Tax=Rhizobium phaseoli TaxID=396 RepID=A0A7K3UFL1_9HYPH|nr:CopG family transcriptional regulator [Rhizobium phaseoli]